jgi:YhcH/YjgK/YiaL family protein
MIVDNFENLNFYRKKFQFLKNAFDFLENERGYFPAFEGRVDIDENIYAVVGISQPKLLTEQKLEAHRKYVDLQSVISGTDVVGWKSLFLCKEVYKEYDAAKDIELFNDESDFQIALNPGSFAFFFASDAHAPLCGLSPVKKCVIKIKTELFL